MGLLAQHYRIMNYRRVFIPNSVVHIVVSTYNRRPILITNINILRQAFKEVLAHYNFEIIAVCVLPDHFHLLIRPDNIGDYPTIIKAVKYNFSKNVGLVSPTYVRAGYKNKREKGIFQRRFFEHTLMNEQEFENHVNYIHYNPVKHGLVDSVIDWQYSTFGKYLKAGLYDADWGRDIEIDCLNKVDI